MDGIKEAAAKTHHDLLIQGPGPMFNTAFTNLKSAKDYRDTLSFDRIKLSKFISAMQNNKIRVIGRGLWYISSADTEGDIDYTIATVNKVLGNF